MSQLTGNHFKTEKALSVLNVLEIKTDLSAVNIEVVHVHYSLRPITRAPLVCAYSVSAVCLPAAFVEI